MNKQLDKLEQAAIDILAVFAPWLGPIPSAYLVGRACINYLSWHWPVAWIAALAVESIGVVSVVLSLRLYEWNDTKNKTDPAAPFNLSILLVATYFVVTIGLTVLLDVFPELARFAPAIFPLLAAVGAVNIAIKNGQQRRELVKYGGSKRSHKKVQIAKEAPTSRSDNSQKVSDWRLLSRNQKEQLSELTTKEIVDTYDVSGSTARRWKQKVSENGYHN